MTLFERLSELRREGVHLWVEDGVLRYAAPLPGLRPPQRQLLESQRDEIIAFLRRADRTRVPPAEPLTPALRAGDPPLTLEQQDLWILHRLEPESSAYNVPGAFELRGRLSVPAFEQALNEIVRRHAPLRGRVGGSDDQPTLRSEPLDVCLRIVDLQGLSAVAAAAARAALARREAFRPFDLRSGPLLRACLIRASAERHTLLLSVHHLVFDRWSLNVFAREARALYTAYAAGGSSPLPDLAIQFADVAWWQHERIARGEIGDGLAWWERALTGMPATIRLPAGRPRALARPAPAAGNVPARVPGAVVGRLRALAQRDGRTLPVALLAAFLVLLLEYTGDEDVCVGLPVAQRDQPGLEDVIGFLINVLPVRHDLSADPTFAALLDRVRDACRDTYARAFVPFHLIVERLRPPTAGNHTPLVQVAVDFQPDTAAAFELPHLTLEALDLPPTAAKFDLLLLLAQHGDEVAATFQYRTDLFEPSTIAAMARRYEALLADLVAASDRPISTLVDRRARAGEASGAHVAVGERIRIGGGVHRQPSSGAVDGEAAREAGPSSLSSPTPTEERVAAVWQQILEVPAVGLDDSFFSMGGNSLLLTQMAARMRERLGHDVPVAELFEFPTVRLLAARLDRAAAPAAAGSSAESIGRRRARALHGALRDVQARRRVHG